MRRTLMPMGGSSRSSGLVDSFVSCRRHSVQTHPPARVFTIKILDDLISVSFENENTLIFSLPLSLIKKIITPT